jgi:hypothetical protein
LAEGIIVLKEIQHNTGPLKEITTDPYRKTERGLTGPYADKDIPYSQKI